MRYTSEYISKLRIHQNSLLTRKVFFRHNFQHWSSSLYQLDHLAFKSYSSSSHLCLQVIFGSGSSLDLDHHHWIWIISRSGSSSLDLDHLLIQIIIEHHHWIWIISRSGTTSLDLDHLSIQIIIAGSGSSLDLDHHRTSSLDLDHLSIWINITGLDLDRHLIWIISRSRSSLLDHHYQIWIITLFGSTLVLSHDSSRHRKFYRASPFSCWLQAYPHVGIFPTLTSELLVRKAHPALTSDHVVNYNPIRKAQHSHSLA